MQLRLLMIIWIMMTIAVDAVNLVEMNRRTIGSLYDNNPKNEDFDLFGNWKNSPTTTTQANSHASIDCTPSSKLHKRLMEKSLENLSSQDLFQDETIDPESLKSHIRVKRRSNFRRSVDKSPSYVHRIPRSRTYETFSSEEMNPADESEAEYGSSLDDDIDVVGNFVNDEMTMKRNTLEDVYPEVGNHQVKHDHSPPEFLKPESKFYNTARLKREKERGGDCENEEGEEYYYEDEEETSNQKVEEQANDAIAPKGISSINTIKESVDQSQTNEEVPHSKDAETLEKNQNQNVIQVNHLNSRNKESYVNVKPAARKNSNNINPTKHKPVKPQPKRKSPAPKKRNKKSPKSHPQKQTTKKKTKPMPSTTKHNHKKPKSNISTLIDNNSNHLKAQNQKNYNAECCDKSISTKKNNRMIKTIVIKAVPKSSSSSSQRLQINVGESKPGSKNNAIEPKAEMSMGEMKDLLTKLIVKVDNLVSEMRSNRVDGLQGNSANQHINCIAKAHRRAAAISSGT